MPRPRNYLGASRLPLARCTAKGLPLDALVIREIGEANVKAASRLEGL